MPAVLVLNAGSSSLKYQVVDPDGTRHLAGVVERIDEHGFAAALAELETRLHAAGLDRSHLAAVGHRVVHGGPTFVDPVVIDAGVEEAIDDLARFAPLHNPPALTAIRAARAEFPDLPHVAVFDTAFFADLPDAAAHYAIDAEVAVSHGVRRYGAHGTSHAYVSGLAASWSSVPATELRQIVLHLGNGASVAAIHGGRPVDTSMGMTPLEGLVMGTRGGDTDPGVLLHLLRGGMGLDELEDLLQHRSGLQGLAGRHDMRDLLAARAGGDPAARLAYDAYVHRLRRYVGGYAAILGGVDQIVFTGGVGENAVVVRADALAGLDGFGIVVDPEVNAAHGQGPRVISAPGSTVQLLVVPTDEELEIARRTAALLGMPGSEVG